MSRVEAEMAPRKEFQGFLNVNHVIPNHWLQLQQICFHFPIRFHSSQMLLI